MPWFPRRSPPKAPTSSPAPVQPLPTPQPQDVTPAAGNAVNPLSRAVLPKEQFPLHYDFLMRDLWSHGHSPEQYQVIAGDEVRLDEDGMDVEFTLVNKSTDQVHRRRVDVRHGRLLGIRDC